MSFISEHRATVSSVIIAVAVLIGLAILIPSTPQNGIVTESIESSGSRIDFPKEKLTLTYWRTIDGVEPFKEIIADYKQLHPNVAIKLINLKTADYDKTLTEAAKAGKLPDIYSVKDDWLPRYDQYNAAAPSSVFSAEEFKQTFVDVVSNRLVDGEAVDGLAYGVSTLGVFYNTELLSKAGYKNPPKTWDEAVQMSQKLTRREGNNISQAGLAIGNSKATGYTAIVSALMQQNGATMTNTPPTQALFNKPDQENYPAGAKAVNFYTSFARPSSKNYAWNDQLGGSLEAFKSGKAAMMIDYAYRAPEIDASNPELKYKMAAFPQVDSKNPKNQAEFWVEQVNKDSKYAEVAWDFLRFASTRTQLNRYSIATYRPAARKDLISLQSEDKYIGPFAKQLNSAVSWYKGNSYNVDGIFSDMISAVLAGGDAQSAVDTAAVRTTQEITTSQ